MKLRIIFTAIVSLFYFAATWIYVFFYSPLAGVANANALNDDVGSYGWAKFVRDGHIQSALDVIWIVLVFIIWFGEFRKPFSTKTNKN